MWPNPQETADLVTFTEEILNRKLSFFCSVSMSLQNANIQSNIVCDFGFILSIMAPVESYLVGKNPVFGWHSYG